MHQHLTEVLRKLDDSRRALRDAVAAIPADARRTRPGPDRWSPVEIIEHLALVETRFSTVVGGKIAEALAAGLGLENDARPPLPEHIGTRMADRVNKRTAPEMAIPTGALDEGGAWAAADKARADFRAAVMRADGRALSRVIHAHPSFGELDAYQWVELIAGHEMRHVAQIKEAAGQLAANQNSARGV